MSLNSYTLFWFRANPCFLFLLNAARLAEKQYIPILLSLVWPDRGSNPRSTALEVSTLTITSSMQFLLLEDRRISKTFKNGSVNQKHIKTEMEQSLYE